MKKFFVLICAAMIFFAGCSNEPPVEVSTEKVLPDEENSTTSHDEKIPLSHGVTVRSNISGKVVATYFKRGEVVEERQPLFKVGKQETESELLRTKTALSESMTALAREMSELSQAEARLRQNQISAQEVADKKFAVEQRQAEIAERQERVEELEEESAAGIVYAPISGKISVEHVVQGEKVLANDTILATIEKDNPEEILPSGEAAH